PLTEDVFRISDMISYAIKTGPFTRGFKNTLFYDWLTEKGDRTLTHFRPGETGALLPNPAMVMMLGAFRTCFCIINNDDGYPGYVGLLDDPSQLWRSNYQAYLDQLLNMFGDKDQNPLLFVKSDGPYDLQLMALEHGRHLPDKPMTLTEVATGRRFKRCVDPSTATLELRIDSEWNGELVEASKSADPSTLYQAAP
ncbi:MAG: hypothetical protein NT113_14350, partial [Hyphomicrobiales bacterium]|nr:hypothetical protein [Hyphomicrobiales bacterium]